MLLVSDYERTGWKGMLALHLTIRGQEGKECYLVPDYERTDGKGWCLVYLTMRGQEGKGPCLVPNSVKTRRKKEKKRKKV